MIMHLLQPQSLHRNTAPTVLASCPFVFNNKICVSTSSFHENISSRNRSRRKINSPMRVRAAEENETELESDQIKAREALRQLDLQLQSLSTKRTTSSPKTTRVSSPILDMNAGRGRDLMKEELPEFSGSFLAYSAFALLFFSIVYNIVFITVIKPSVDGPEPELAQAPTIFITNTNIMKEVPNPGRIMESVPLVATQK